MNGGSVRDALNLAHHRLRRLVGRVRLAGEDEHDRPLRLADELLEPAEVRDQQRRALVGREAPREADREHVRVVGIDELEQALHVRFAQAVALILLP